MKKDIKKPVKDAFDKTAFVFTTKVVDIEAALQRLKEQDEDPNAEPLTKDEVYWWGWWDLNMPELKRRNMTEVLTCAQENAALKLYKKPTRKKKK